MNESNRIEGKICLVTGATSGIGLATAWKLASLGGTVVMAGRNAERGETARQKVMRKSGNPNVHLVLGDFSSLDEVRALADAVISKFPALHVLINNAGVVTPRRKQSKDGFEMQFAVNHLAPFLLTNLLLPLMKTSAPGRIITVSSSVYSWGEIDFNNLQSEGHYDPVNVYAMTKLANILFTIELAKRLEGSLVTANSLHPGVINTNLYQNYYGRDGTGGASDDDLERGAETCVYLATSPDVASVSGRYFSNLQQRTLSHTNLNEETAQRLWRVSEQLIAQSH